MIDPRPGRIEILSDEERVKLLKTHDLGRIAVVDREVRPLIFPINYFFDEVCANTRPARFLSSSAKPGGGVAVWRT